MTMAKRGAAAHGPDGLPVEEFADADAFDRWLQAHHADSRGIWMRIARSGATETTVTWKDAVPVALRWGWIDGQRRSLDDTHFLQRWTPRRARSVWSRINVGHAERLIAAGLMTPAGMAHVEAAHADGRWQAAYEGSSKMVPPPELQKALDADPVAAAAYATLSASARYSICWRVQTARRAETKERRVAQFIEELRASRS